MPHRRPMWLIGDWHTSSETNSPHQRPIGHAWLSMSVSNGSKIRHVCLLSGMTVSIRDLSETHWKPFGDQDVWLEIGILDQAWWSLITHIGLQWVSDGCLIRHVGLRSDITGNYQNFIVKQKFSSEFLAMMCMVKTVHQIIIFDYLVFKFNSYIFEL